VLAVVIAAPIATLLAYLPSVGGDLTKLLAHEGGSSASSTSRSPCS
jgi:hypothetical protein